MSRPTGGAHGIGFLLGHCVIDVAPEPIPQVRCGLGSIPYVRRLVRLPSSSSRSLRLMFAHSRRISFRFLILSVKYRTIARICASRSRSAPLSASATVTTHFSAIKRWAEDIHAYVRYPFMPHIIPQILAGKRGEWRKICARGPACSRIATKYTEEMRRSLLRRTTIHRKGTHR